MKFFHTNKRSPIQLGIGSAENVEGSRTSLGKFIPTNIKTGTLHDRLLTDEVETPLI
jgi:hypothetical protein